MKPLSEILKMDNPSEYLYNYAISNKQRLEPKWERLLLSLGNPEWAYYYAKNIIKERWPEAEEYIKKDPKWAYWYAEDIIKGRWPEAEDIIIKDPEWAYYYAEDVIKGRWPEAEKYIIKDPRYACWYANDVIKGRWPEAELYIKEDEFCWGRYRSYFGIKS